MPASTVQIKPFCAAPTRPALLDALPVAMLVIDAQEQIVEANHKAEMVFGGSLLKNKSLSQWMDMKSFQPLFAAARKTESAREYNYVLQGPRCAPTRVNMHIAPWLEDGQWLVMIDEWGVAGKLAARTQQQEAARAANVMAGMLAHEVKNPLSGIRGAAQLLEETVGDEDKKLTRLIISEVDRISTVLGEVEFFTGDHALHHQACNIHEILDYVKSITLASFPSLRIEENYDPSLPEISGNKEQLVSLFANLTKNAAEAYNSRIIFPVGEAKTSNSYGQPTIRLTTSYQTQYKFKPPGDDHFISLPICIAVEDNGSGVPPAIRDTLFDPCVTAKEGGKGLGLAIAAKIAHDHGGVLELESAASPTRFQVMLPLPAREKP